MTANQGDEPYEVGEDYAPAPAPGGSDHREDPYAGLAPASGVTTPRAPHAPAAPAAPAAPVAPKQANRKPRAVRWITRKKGRVLWVGLAVWAALGLGYGGVVSLVDHFRPPPGYTPSPELDTAWIATPTQFGSAGSEFASSMDGAFGETHVIAGEHTWVATIADPGDPGARGAVRQVVGLDPATGTPRWHHDLPGAMCGDAEIEGQIMCVSREAGWRVTVIETATGAVITSSATDLSSVRTVHHTAAGLIVVGEAEPAAPHAQISLITPEGTTAWSLDVATIEGAEYLFDNFLAGPSQGQSAGPDTMERPRWRNLAGGLVMLWSTPGVAVIDPATGTIFTQECRRATPIGDAYFCANAGGIQRHALDGTLAWSLPGLDLVPPLGGSDGRPLAVTAQHELVAVDWETGTRGEVLHRFAQQPGGFTGTVLPPSGAGTAEMPLVLGDDAMVALAPEADRVLWTYTVTEEDGYLGEALVVGDRIVAGSHHIVILDAATGAETWRGIAGLGIYLVPVGEALATIGFAEFALYELP